MDGNSEEAIKEVNKGSVKELYWKNLYIGQVSSNGLPGHCEKHTYDNRKPLTRLEPIDSHSSPSPV